LLGLVLLIAVVGGWRDAPERLLRALTPNLSSLAATGPVSLTLSLTPPTYTNLARSSWRSATARTPAATPTRRRTCGCRSAPTCWPSCRADRMCRT